MIDASRSVDNISSLKYFCNLLWLRKFLIPTDVSIFYEQTLTVFCRGAIPFACIAREGDAFRVTQIASCGEKGSLEYRLFLTPPLP